MIFFPPICWPPTWDGCGRFGSSKDDWSVGIDDNLEWSGLGRSWGLCSYDDWGHSVTLRTLRHLAAFRILGIRHHKTLRATLILRTSIWGKGPGRFIKFRRQNNTILFAVLSLSCRIYFFFGSNSQVITFGCMYSVLFFHYHRHISGHNQHTMPVLECRSFHYIRKHLLINRILVKIYPYLYQHSCTKKSLPMIVFLISIFIPWPIKLFQSLYRSKF